MAMTSMTTYTAKLTDGPLEGKTIAMGFLDSGDPRPRLEIPTTTEGKHYLYVRSSGIEYAADDVLEGRPSAIEYRFVETIFD